MDLRSRVITGMFWTAGARLVSQAWTWAITIIVIRLLTPTDYGLLAMATIFIAFFALVAEAGVGAALVQAPELDDTMLRRVFGAVIVINCTFFVLQFALAPLIADFFQEERLVMIIRVLSVQYLLTIFTAIPSALLSRHLDFKRQSIISVLASVLGSLTSLVLAYRGYGVWALVISNIVVCVWHAIAINVVSPYLRKPEFSVRGMRNLLAAGTQLTATRVLWFIYSQADVFIAGKILGKELLGFYSVSLHLASLPVQRLSALMNQIAYPAFAEAQRKTQAIPFYMLKVVRVLSMISFPVLWGISAVAAEIVVILLGPKWEAAVLPMQLLPLVMPINLIGLFLNTAFQAIGQTRVALANALTATAVLPIAFYVGAQWGLLGLSVAWLGGYTTVLLLNLARMLPLVGLRIRDVLQATAVPAFAALTMYGTVALVRHYAGGRMQTPVLALVLIVAGALVYCAVTLMMNRSGVRELTDLVRARRR